MDGVRVKMSNISNLHKYKRAKVIVKDLNDIIKAMSLSIQALTFFKKYAPVMDAIHNLKDNKVLLEIHLDKQKRIVETKGEEEYIDSDPKY